MIAGTAVLIFSTGMTAAIMLTAVMAFPMVMMAANRIGIEDQRTVEECLHRSVRAAGCTRKKLDASIGKSCTCAATDTTADQRISAIHLKKTRQRTMTAAVCTDDLTGNNLTILNGIELKGGTMTKVLENKTILISYCNFHFRISFLFQRQGVGGLAHRFPGIFAFFILCFGTAAVLLRTGNALCSIRHTRQFFGQNAQGRTVNCIMSEITVLLTEDQSGFTQHFQMLGHRRLRYIELAG